MDKDENRAQPVAADTTSGRKADIARPGHAQALIRPWSRLGRQLVPLIGEGGFVALFTRSARLLAPPRPWLSVDLGRRTSTLLLTALENDLAGADPAEAAATHEELMGIFVRQLGALIGPALTTRLLTETGAVGTPQKNQEEQKQ
ncbi:hypothetical protein [Massilia sp. Root335]|jgi:hypothetical protein|uniref:hypothetical protein n=1 Tax=Massilia sp. Root335 TaxID=1736517 RepID=UPI0006FBF91D|nr:hypothetical protein [Massilia sp. Root335]KQV51979.1 hypothetical protein ASC93_04845 [Massilia sp. Root335]